MSNKRINKAYIRYDGNGRVIAGALLLNRFKPTGGGKWHEIPAYECCNSGPTGLSFRLLFSNITEVNAIVGDSTDVNNWNTYFDLPIYGTAFTSVSVIGNEVKLYGGSNIIIKQSLFDQPDRLGTYLLEVDDAAGSIIEVEDDGFGYDQGYGCENLTSVNLPNVVTIGVNSFYTCYALTTINLPNLITADGNAFYECTALETINLPLLTTMGYQGFNFCISLKTVSLPSCTNLGGTVGNDSVFTSVSGNTITLTVPAALMTCDAGNPDGDIVYLQANNTVTVVTV